MPRLARLPRRMRGFAGALMALAVIVWAGAGAFIYYNTVVLNEYRNSVSDEAWTADYERTLYKYHTVPQPMVTDVTMNVAIYPHDNRVVSEGRYAMVNATTKPMTVVHVRWPRGRAGGARAGPGARGRRRGGRVN